MPVVCAMGSISRVLLRAGGYQVFALFMFALFVGVAGTVAFGRHNRLALVSFVPAIVCFVAWAWAAGSLLAWVVPLSRRSNVAFFRYALLHCLFYTLLWFGILAFGKLFDTPLGVGFHVLTGVNFFVTLACVGYCIGYLARSIAAAQSGQVARRSMALLLAVALVVLPITILWFQPFINQLYEPFSDCSQEPATPAPPPGSNDAEPTVPERSVLAGFFLGLFWVAGLHWLVLTGTASPLLAFGEFAPLIVHVVLAVCLAGVLAMFRRFAVLGGYLTGCLVPFIVETTVLTYYFRSQGRPYWG